MGRDLKIAFADGDEGRHVLNPVGIQVMESDPVLVEEPAEEAVRRQRKSAFVKANERHHVARGGRGVGSASGRIHSRASVSSGRWPEATSSRRVEFDTVEDIQYAIFAGRQEAV